MAYCTNCGQKVPRGAKYCPKCGESLSNFKDDSSSTVKREHDTVKCRACGAILPSFTAVCPECGTEIRNATSSESVKVFMEKLHQFDVDAIQSQSRIPQSGWSTWSTWGKIWWVILNIYTLCIPILISSSKKKTDAQMDAQQPKASYIKSYVVPYDRESILELLIFIKSQFYSLADGPVNKISRFWESVWVEKAQQIMETADISIRNDPQIEQISNDIVGLYERFKKRQLIKRIAIWGGIALFVIYSLVYGQVSN